MTVALRNSPPASAFLGDLASFYHWDSYEAPLRRDDLVMHEAWNRTTEDRVILLIDFPRPC